MLKIRIFMPLILATVLLLAGCGNKDEGTTQQVSSTQEQDYIKRIENDPNMPPTSTNYNWEGTNKDSNYAYGLAVDWPGHSTLSEQKGDKSFAVGVLC